MATFLKKSGADTVISARSQSFAMNCTFGRILNWDRHPAPGEVTAVGNDVPLSDAIAVYDETGATPRSSLRVQALCNPAPLKSRDPTRLF